MPISARRLCRSGRIRLLHADGPTWPHVDEVHAHVAESELLGGDAGDVKYPYHLVNGRVPADPDVYTGKPGKRVRLRIINAGGDTAYRVRSAVTS